MDKFIIRDAITKKDQKSVMDEIARQKHCPFCREHLSKYHKKPIIKSGKFWTLTENQWPYEKTKHHLLAIHNDHIEHIKDIDPEAGKELIELFQNESIKRNMPGGGIAIRFGNHPHIGCYGNSILHLHAHIVEPDLESLDQNEKWTFELGRRNKTS